MAFGALTLPKNRVLALFPNTFLNIPEPQCLCQDFNVKRMIPDFTRAIIDVLLKLMGMKITTIR